MKNLVNISLLDELMYELDANFSAAESHGALCGMLCASGTADLSKWMLHALGENQSSSVTLQRVGKQLQQLHQTTLVQINSSEMNFELLLPDDEELLEVRVEALANWCQGFAYGLVVGGIKQETKMPDNCKEVIADIIEISRAGYLADDEATPENEEAEEADFEEDELAFVEVSEYVRISTLLLYEELQPLECSKIIH